MIRLRNTAEEARRKSMLRDLFAQPGWDVLRMMISGQKTALLTACMNAHEQSEPEKACFLAGKAAGMDQLLANLNEIEKLEPDSATGDGSGGAK